MKWWTPDIDPNLNYYERGRFILIWRICVLFAVILNILAVLNYDQESIVTFIYGAEGILAILSLFYLHKYRNSQVIFWIFTLSATAFVLYSMYSIKHTLHYSDFMWIMCIVLFAFIGLKYWQALIFTGIHAIGIMHFLLFELNDHLGQLRPRTTSELATTGIETTFAFIIMSALIYQNIKFQNYALSELRKTHQTLEKQNIENVTLLKEIHHRVKNNLQIVVSLLRMQRAKIPSKETQDEFDTAVKRIMTISLIHNKLYNSNHLSTICFKNYMEQLISDLTSFSDDNENIDVQLDSNIEEIDMNSMIPLGLIINELVTNSIKHSHEENKPIRIQLSFHETDDGKVNMTYTDDGVWKESQNEGLGLELIQSLNRQLDGEMERIGSTYNMKFQLD